VLRRVQYIVLATHICMLSAGLKAKEENARIWSLSCLIARLGSYLRIEVEGEHLVKSLLNTLCVF